ncbi:MAG: hypothetical protein Ct9H90mP3_2050 [Flammeovirgaceae bacterium]|nr:MAG: hypothetical protein Ct9H90mP3_2050 [Flammeovirgaceae bacterium]
MDEDNYDGIEGYYLPIDNSNNYWIEYNNTDLNPEIIEIEDQILLMVLSSVLFLEKWHKWC